MTFFMLHFLVQSILFKDFFSSVIFSFNLLKTFGDFLV